LVDRPPIHMYMPYEEWERKAEQRERNLDAGIAGVALALPATVLVLSTSQGMLFIGVDDGSRVNKR
jgi:hypothetical protein